MFNHQDNTWSTSGTFKGYFRAYFKVFCSRRDRHLICIFSVPVTSGGADEETVSTLRQRLKTMKEMFGDDIDTTDTAKRKKAAKRRNGNCIDNLIDGSFMGFVLAMCLTMVLGAAFFAFKNLYFAVSKKIWVDRSEL